MLIVADQLFLFDEALRILASWFCFCRYPSRPLAALYVTMFLRSTNNSLVAGLDATSLSGQSEDLPPSTSANAEILRPSSSDAHIPLPQTSRQADVPFPAFLGGVVAAVKQVLAANQTPMSAEASSSVAGDVPATFSSSLQSQLQSRLACSFWRGLSTSFGFYGGSS